MLLYPKKITDNQTLLIFVKPNSVVIALGTNGNSYFQKNGNVMGFHFELMKKYCSKIERNPVFVVEENIVQRLNLLHSGEVDIVICDEKIDSIAQLENITSGDIPNNTMPALWAVDSENNNLAKNIHLWINSFSETKDYQLLVAKYGIDKNQNPHQNHISVYDDLIKKYAEKINWDWRLIAALIYQESQFIPDLQSRKDAFGLMQLRQQTINFLGFDNVDSNEQNIAAGTKLIQYLDKYFAKDSIINPNERIRFVLAAYNAGHGKIDICRRNTKLKHGNPNIWKHVEIMSQQTDNNKTSSSKKPVLSRETIAFVREILERYEHYKNFFPE